MTLAELLEHQFRGDLRFRGEAYLKAERVAITEVTPDIICGSVREGAEHQTQLTRVNGGVKLFCTCLTEKKKKKACKHLWATILAADSAGYVSPSLKPGHIPPFLKAEPQESLAEEGDDLFPAEPGFPLGGEGEKRSALRRSAARKPWEERLAALRDQMGSPVAGGNRERTDQEILYEIDVPASRECRRLVVQLLRRHRRAGGKWGTLKPLRLRSDRLEEVPHEKDRRILAFLLGARVHLRSESSRAATSRATGRGGHSPGGTSSFELPFELAVLVLPSMCETNRLIVRQADTHRPVPLCWEEEGPWQLAVELQSAEEEDSWQLVGHLERDGERRPLAEARLLLPGGLVLLRNRIGLLEDYDAFDWIDGLSLESGLTVAREDGEAFVDQLLDLPALPRLHLPEPLRLEEVRGEPQPFLFVKTPSPNRRRWQSELLEAEVHFDYAGVMVPAASTRWAIVQRERGRCLLRNSAAEEHYWLQLQDAGFRRLQDHRRREADAVISIRDLGTAVRQLVGQGWQVLADQKPLRQPSPLQFRVRSDIDWFELDAEIRFDDQQISFPEFLSALNRGDTTLRLADGSLGVLPEEWLQEYGLLAGLARVEGDRVRLARNQVALLDALLSTRSEVDYDGQFLELKQRLLAAGEIGEEAEPDGFRGHLRSYQRLGIGWLTFLEECRFGGCLADDMGLGKTIQILALLLKRKAKRDEHRPSLVVVPKSLLFNWRKECRRFTPGLSVVEYIGTKRGALRSQLTRYDIVLTTYGTLRRDVLQLKDTAFDYVILDEAQMIKNASSQVAKASRLLQARHRVALSGTPIENHLGDLWSIFEFLNPGMLGRSSLFRSYTTDSEDEQTRTLLARALRPFILRRTKQEVAHELPEKSEQTILCRMGSEQRRLYNELRNHYRQSLLGLVAEQGLKRSKMHVLEALLRLRQAACHPGLLDAQYQEHSSAKLDFLIPHLEELIEEGHKALVFSQFTSMLAIVRQQLDQRGLLYAYLDGQTRDRKTPVEQFQNDPACPLFLISLKAGGLGLNLTAADYVFLLDPWWNPAVETQAIDRAHRVGQIRHVFAYRLICHDTVEEKILKLQKKKKSLAEAILSSDGSSDGTLLKNLTPEDLELLLS